MSGKRQQLQNTDRWLHMRVPRSKGSRENELDRRIVCASLRWAPGSETARHLYKFTCKKPSVQKLDCDALVQDPLSHAWMNSHSASDVSQPED
eukprot:scaffold25174_cov19-Tisochrysis_lutea.AAC.1